MHLVRVSRTIPRLKYGLSSAQYSQAVLEDEYSDTPEYPPIVDTSLKGRNLQKRDTLHTNIRNINTIEEKQIALNLPRYYGWKCIMLTDDKVPYNALPLVKTYTRSHFISTNELPELYKQYNETADSVVKEIKALIENVIITENEGVTRQFNTTVSKPKVEELENAQTECIVRQMNRLIINALADRTPHILPTQIDYKPRHEAFWFVGGVDVPASIVKARRKLKWKTDLYAPVDRSVQYIGSPILTLRNRLPLKPLIPYAEADNPEFKVPKFTHVPQSVGYHFEFRHGTNIPGYWPGDVDEYGLLSVHNRGHILSRKESFGSQDNLEALHCQALLASFGWLLAQANYQGFTTFNDITYPLVTQTVISNGQMWSLYAYQLNTIEMFGEKIDDNPRHNVCYGTNPLKLYDTIENGQVKGLNEDVLKMLIQFYLNVPEERDHDMKPYLGKDEQIVADIEDDKKRCWLESTYKHLVANRPKHYLLPEVYLWEKIYKIEHNTRFHEPKRRPFERGINPFKRRLDEHLPPYIPKVLRPYPKARKRFETTYYPKV